MTNAVLAARTPKGHLLRLSRLLPLPFSRVVAPVAATAEITVGPDLLQPQRPRFPLAARRVLRDATETPAAARPLP